MDAGLLERLAEVSHDQWVEWSRRLAAQKSRWHRLWVPYADLPEEAKEMNRETARKMVRVLCECCEKNRP
jgi:hypothetical protein